MSPKLSIELMRKMAIGETAELSCYVADDGAEHWTIGG